MPIQSTSEGKISLAKGIIRDAKTLQTYKPGLEEGFGQKLRKV